MHSRRSFLQVGYLGLGGLSLPDLFSARRVHASSPTPAATSAIFILLAGGPSHIDTLDPKPGAAAEIRGEFKAIPTAIPGVRFSDQLPLLARDLSRFSVVRSISHSVVIHDPGQRYILTGVKNPRSDIPSLGSVVALYKRSHEVMPTFAAIPAIGPTAGELGQSCEPYNVLGDSGRLIGLGPREADAKAIKELQRRFDLLQSIDDTSPSEGIDSELLRIRRDSYRQAFELLRSDRLRNVANLDTEPSATRDRYGRTDVGNYLLIARRLIEAGTRFVTVILGGWDTHINGFATLRALLPPLDQGLSALLWDLDERHRLPSTIVAAMGEFGRTPQVNAQVGRDHWPAAMSVLLAGGGIAGGRVIGSTDKQGAQPMTVPHAPEDVAFTVLNQLGIEPAKTQVPPTGRILLTSGRRITELL